VRLDVADDAASAARRAAAQLAAALGAAVQARGRASVAFSGGRSPRAMFAALAALPVAWADVDVFQVDERVAAAGEAERNLTALQSCLVEPLSLAAERVHSMPVEASDLAQAAASYAAVLRGVCGEPPQLDVAHLGLGDDGHTASLVPGDAVLAVDDREVAIAGPYQGRLRMTLTFPVLRRARTLVWLVTGAAKAPMLARLLAGDETIPAGRLRSESGVVFADRAAAALARR
jgi:6-phosphogluconolactonase